MNSLCFGRRNPPPMQTQEQRTKTAAWWTLIQGKGREGQRMAIGREAPPAADEDNTSATCQPPPPRPPCPVNDKVLKKYGANNSVSWTRRSVPNQLGT